MTMGADNNYRWRSKERKEEDHWGIACYCKWWLLNTLDIREEEDPVMFRLGGRRMRSPSRQSERCRTSLTCDAMPEASNSGWWTWPDPSQYTASSIGDIHVRALKKSSNVNAGFELESIFKFWFHIDTKNVLVRPAVEWAYYFSRATGVRHWSRFKTYNQLIVSYAEQRIINGFNCPMDANQIWNF